MSENSSVILQDLKRRLEQFLGVSLLKIVLYGSRARGDYHAESDIDIAIIVRGMDHRLKDKIFDLIADVELEYLTPLSTIVFSEADFNLLLSRERRIALDIEAEGIPL